MDGAEVVIGGGGIIGLTVALEFAQSGFSVSVLERGRVMAEASWAAAGMLAAEDPENPAELAELAALSRSLYPEYLNTVEALSGRAVPLRTDGTLQATSPGGAFRCPSSPTRFPIAAAEAARRIEGLASADRSLLWLEEASLDPRDLCAALPAAAAAAGVLLYEKTRVLAVEPLGNSVRITTPEGRLSAGAFLNCCGAWAGEVDHPAQGARRPAQAVEPRKGQMIAVQLPAPSRLEYVVRTPEVYLVPRGDGRIVIGATVERAGFDRSVEPMTAQGLLTRAAAIWPPAASGRIVDRWAGLRPGTSDGLPLIGGAGEANCWLATGHFRNGILLAPATALVMRQILKGEPPAAALHAFSAARPLLR